MVYLDRQGAGVFVQRAVQMSIDISETPGVSEKKEMPISGDDVHFTVVAGVDVGNELRVEHIEYRAA
jgi:hypothetical protein